LDVQTNKSKSSSATFSREIFSALYYLVRQSGLLNKTLCLAAALVGNKLRTFSAVTFFVVLPKSDLDVSKPTFYSATHCAIHGQT
jgi:hypothetical protein